MINVAILGYGIVGSGVIEVIKKNRESISQRAGEEILVKKILDIRDFPESPDKDVLTKNQDEVFLDDSIQIVVETIGGIGIAYEFTLKALRAGKSVVTSNKELVATHGPELLKLAKENGVSYLFEASVGGGIPIIRPLNQCLAANEIIGITGILNGTTNYILTKMRKEGVNFEEAIKGAQENGYAEANPTADVEGHDACRKIAILSSIAYHQFVDYHDIYTEGITKITTTDMQYAQELNAVIKLIGMSYTNNNKIYARVSPAIVSNDHPLSGVEDVFNAIVVKGNAIGEAMFYGRGAGKLPTASAVVADIIDIVKRNDGNGQSIWERTEEPNMIAQEEGRVSCLVRILAKDAGEATKKIPEAFGNVKWIRRSGLVPDGELAFVTDIMTEKALQESVEKLKAMQGIEAVESVIRILGE